MACKNKIIKVEDCGCIVEMIYPGEGVDVCSLNQVEAKESGEGEAKHVPVITRVDDGYLVTVGEVEHPMDEDHFIAMIELIADGQVHKQYLDPGDKPEALFKIPECEDLKAKEYCTKHGLWQS
ncbi:MAG: desulfoferrodoxin [Methanosphaera sp.]|nr:desulfoferrodoxin [Methanosphaera sp.]